MDLCVIIPVKPFREAKQRLAPVLNPAGRAQLAERMFRHVLGVASTFFGAPKVLVVSRSSDVLAIAQHEGAQGLPERSTSGLNAALTEAMRFALTLGTSRSLILASDLPLLRRDDLAEMAKHNSAIAPDRHFRGTNALLWPATSPVEFGENSFARHQAIAQNAAFQPHIITRAGLTHDVDVPEDLIGTSLSAL